jgi:hypothetical protein
MWQTAAVAAARVLSSLGSSPMRGIMRYAVAGVLVAGMVVLVQAQPGGGFGRFGGGPTALVNNKAVQEDLKINEETAKKLSEWSKEFGKKAQEIRKDKGIEFGKGGGFGKGGLSPEMQEKLAAANAEISKEAYKELGDLLSKDQITRLKQIERQQLGVRAFTNAEVVENLKLTDSQKTSVMGLTGDFQKESREIRGEAGKGKFDFAKFQEDQKKIDKLEKEYVSKAVDLLDDTQKKKWKEMVGEPFDLSKLQGGFGRKNAKKDE